MNKNWGKQASGTKEWFSDISLKKKMLGRKVKLIEGRTILA